MAKTWDYSLLVVQDEPHYADESTFCSEANYGYFVNWVGAHAARTTLAVPTARGCTPFGQPLDLPNVAFKEMPYWRSLSTYVRLGRREKRALRALARELVSQHDAVMVRLPSLAAALFARQARLQNRTLVTYLGGNILTAANPLRASNALIRVTARILARYVDRVMMRIVGEADLCFAVGHELFGLCKGRARRAVQLMTSLIPEACLLEREDSHHGEGGWVLFRAARINPNKGTQFLLEALALLLRRGYDVRLKLAGGTNDPVHVAGLRAWCDEHGIADRVDWLGHVAFGEDLFEHYRGSHIGVLSSLSEGFPRFVGEAWAFSLPVVATDLPALRPPAVPDDNALLVAPGSGQALADAIARVIEDTALRRRIIRAGAAVARQNTAEGQSKRVADLIGEAVSLGR
ncbi:MAG: glycosyltransferase family 4 protein [Phycisphaerae bacterium]